MRNDCDDPRCPCHGYRKTQEEIEKAARCTLGKPLWMVIPPEGVHIQCPVHGKHFIPGNQVRCMAAGQSDALEAEGWL